MSALRSATVSFITATLMPLSAPAVAAGPYTAIQTFGEIEFRSDPRALMDEVRAGLSAEIPAGSRIEEARAILAQAGAHCRAPQTDGSVRCLYHGTHFEGDDVEAVTWTVNLATEDGKVSSFTVKRYPA
jgi:hypothetical protein